MVHIVQPDEYADILAAYEKVRSWPTKRAMEAAYDKLIARLCALPEGRGAVQVATLQSALESATETNRVLANRLLTVANEVAERKREALADSKAAKEDSEPYNAANHRFMELANIELILNGKAERSPARA